MTRRTIRISALSLALGLATTLAVAIICGLTLDTPYIPLPGHGPALSRGFVKDGAPWSVTEYSGQGATLAWWGYVTRDFFSAPDPILNPTDLHSAGIPPPPLEDPKTLLAGLAAVRREGAPLIPTTDRPAWWGQFASGATPPIPASGVRPIGADIGYGWPCIALWYQVTGYSAFPYSFNDETRGAIIVQGSAGVRGQIHCRVIPFLPAWFGLTTNTLLFGAVWALLLFGVPTLRRTIRHRRGLCEHCGYDLRATPAHLPCPECGRTPAGR